MSRLAAAFILLIGLGLAAAGEAHEVRPAYLELKESAPGSYEVLWKVPMRGDLTLRLEPVLPDGCDVEWTSLRRAAGNAAVSRGAMSCASGLAGGTLAMAGHDATIVDTLVRIEHRDGAVRTALLTPEERSLQVGGTDGVAAVARTYFTLGIDHILEGFDHLLFVMALLLLVSGWRRIALTITAFTLAHSLTLALATLELVRVPSAVVEALIALSIVLVAVEIVRSRDGEATLGGRMPWLIAFAFGLLHGLGFAGALTEIGLPEDAIPAALLFFNLGVEAGQLAVVAAVLTSLQITRHVGLGFPSWGWRAATYAIGSLAAFWTFERLAAT